MATIFDVEERNHIVRHANRVVLESADKLTLIACSLDDKSDVGEGASEQVTQMSRILAELGWGLDPAPGRETWELTTALLPDLRHWLPEFLSYDKQCLEDDEREWAGLEDADDGRKVLSKDRADIQGLSALLQRVGGTNSDGLVAG